MTHIQQVKHVLKHVDNQFTVRDVQNLMPETELTGEQIGKAIRSIDFVENLGKGQYKIKGRKVNV